MHSPDFEMGIIKILEGREQHLTGAEHQAVAIFRKPDSTEEYLNDDEGTLAERIAKKRKLSNQNQRSSAFVDLKFIPPTSNQVERLFSKARLTLGMTRHGLLPVTLEAILFLQYHKCFWGVEDVKEISRRDDSIVQDELELESDEDE